jgi:hypothetical protein
MGKNFKNIKVSEVINRDSAVSSDDGENVYTNILDAFKEGNIVELDFSDITLMTTAFLNSAIGQLYSKFTSEELNTSLKLKNVAQEDGILFKKVVDRAKQYQANKKGFEDSANSAIYGS